MSLVNPVETEMLRVAVAQVNPTVGDLEGNVSKAKAALALAEAAGADLAVFPELAITGYPPEDLVFRPGFVAAVRSSLDELAAHTGRCAAAVGFVDGYGESTRDVPDMADEGAAFNAVAVCADGRVHGIYHKRHLPNYDVFDEIRNFRPGQDEPPSLFEIAGAMVGITVCEDAWVDSGPLSDLADSGAQLVVNVSASPFREGKQAAREEIMGRRASSVGVSLLYANLVGGQDSLVFDGGSFLVDATGAVTARCGSFVESVDVFDVELPPRQPTTTAAVPVTTGRTGELGQTGTTGQAGVARRPRISAPLVAPLSINKQRWAALVLATADYVRKTGFTDVAVGLSGGVDSSLVTSLAADALGAANVHGVVMPSRYSSAQSAADAEKLAANLGIDLHTIGIEPAHSALTKMLLPGLGVEAFTTGGLTDQNLQARIRGTTLMALANQHDWLVLTTGNKSEMAVGYSTLYGDTAGAYAVISDVWKLTVYELCRWRNRQAGHELIPANVLAKPPSAELAPGQRDDQSLPAYEVLDPILRLYVEEFRSVAEIQALGLAPPEEVARVCHLVDIAEYKRRQSPLGPRITGRAFGRDRRMPIVNRYR